MPSRVGARCDAGQVLPLLALLLALAAGVALLVVRFGVAATDRAQARTAADAAALAGALDGAAAARALAEANGAEVLELAADPPRFSVLVRVGAAEARATAERVGSPVVPGGGDREGLAPAMVAALARADDVLGTPVPVVSGFRSRAEQQRLWDERASNPYPVARPGTSMHERGLAVDVPLDVASVLVGLGPVTGLCQPLGGRDPVHFEPCPPTAPG